MYIYFGYALWACMYVCVCVCIWTLFIWEWVLTDNVWLNEWKADIWVFCCCWRVQTSESAIRWWKITSKPTQAHIAEKFNFNLYIILKIFVCVYFCIFNSKVVIQIHNQCAGRICIFKIYNICIYKFKSIYIQIHHLPYFFGHPSALVCTVALKQQQSSLIYKRIHPTSPT